MADITVNNADVEALAGKFEGMSDQFSDAEKAALQALFTLAGIGLQSGGADVSGFQDFHKPVNFELNCNPAASSQQGILIGMLKSPAAGFGTGGGMLKIEGQTMKW